MLIGENGAGKSTLLRILAGLLRPSMGTVKVFGDLEPHEARARIGYMSHAPMLYDELTAQENLRYFASLYPGRACLTPAEALRQVGLDPDLPRTLGQYSQGMRQRTSLARVLLPVPELLLLDEPFSNMDVESRAPDGRAARRLPPRQPDHRPHHPSARARRPHRRLCPRPARRARRVVRAREPHPMKTNGARFLESLGIPFELREYEVDPEDLSAITVAKKIGMPAEQVFKTLLTTGGPGDLSSSP